MGNRTASHQGSNYSYLPFNRLVTANSNGYSYDSNGNRTASHHGSSYGYQPFNRLITDSDSYGYDLNASQSPSIRTALASTTNCARLSAAPLFTSFRTISAPRANEVRYYLKEDEEHLERLVGLLKGLQLEVKTVHFQGYETSSKLRPGHYELWFAAESKAGENWYLEVSYTPGTRQSRDAFIQQITPTIEGGTLERVTPREIRIGPYTEDQARSVRERLSEMDPELKKERF